MGEFVERRLRSMHADPSKCGEPFCTHSEMVGYYDHRKKRVALVHQYLRPDGYLGASGRPDPKAILQGRTLLIPTADEDG